MNARRLTLTALASLCTLVGALALSATALALQAHVFSGSFGGEGSETGQFKEPEGIAVNDTTHDLYVVDRANNRVEQFTSAGAYVGQFDGSTAPTGAFSAPQEIAVDNSGNPLDPSAGDVYVVDSAHDVIDKFGAGGEYLGQIKEAKSGSPFGVALGIAIDPAGVVWVLQRVPAGSDEIDSFSDALVNAFSSEISPAGYGEETIGHGIAVDSKDNLYIDNRQGDGTLKINSSGEQLSQELVSGASPTGIAVDTSDDAVYIGTGGTIEVFSASLSAGGPTPRGILTERFGAEHLVSSSGVAVDSSSHTVYVADAGADKVEIFHDVLLPDVATSEEPPVQEHEGSARLEGTVDPDGVPVTSCEFEYGTEAASLGSTAPCEPAPASESSPVAVHADVSGLTPLTHYYYRLVAGNANGSSKGTEFTFFAAKAPTVDGESFLGVTSSSVTFKAHVNPDGGNTAYRFEYGPTTSYGTNVSGPAGAGVESEEINVHVQDLQPATVYHFRVLAINSVATAEGVDETFTTQAAGGEFTLLDNRAWEMVTPPNKQGAGLDAVGDEQGADIQAASDGSAITYVATAPFVANPAGSRSPEGTQIFSSRGAPGSWETADIATPHYEGASSLTLGNGGEYKLFSTDLSLGLVAPNGYTPLPPLPAGAEKTIYLRTAAGEYKALVTSANVAPGIKIHGTEGPDSFSLKFIAGTPDLSHIVIESGVALTADPGDTGGLYEWAGGQLQKVGVLPKGGLTDGELGHRDQNVRDAISEDGSRVIWAGGEAHSLYMRDMVRGETVQIDAAQGTTEPGGSDSVYRTASGNDSRVFFTSSERLTADSTAPGTVGPAPVEDLYEFEVTSGEDEPLAGKLTDLTVDGNVGESAGVLGVIGASEDGSEVYFVAKGVLGDAAEQHAVPGTNLYAAHYDEATKTWSPPTFIAALSSEDYRSWGAEVSGNSQSAGLQTMTSRVSPNGRYLAFMSERSLTGYENRDANSGAPDEEVYLYDTSSNKLICASCDPTGARPDGVLGQVTYFRLADFGGLWTDRWFAGNLPGWTTLNLDNALYQSRYLSNSGRLFFNNSDGLVPADVNSQEDVYEYEPAGMGGCQGVDHGQSASVVFSENLSGCVGLISSGTSSEESAFMDASETGGDVFFLTSSRLAAQDGDTSYDLYDAHECTASRPCAPTPTQVLPPCTTGDACKAAPTPQPAIFGSPSSETFSGAGNVAPASVITKAVKSKSAAQSRVEQLAKALKACAKKSKSKRKRCQAQARKRNGSAHKAAKTDRRAK